VQGFGRRGRRVSAEIVFVVPSKMQNRGGQRGTQCPLELNVD